MSTIPFGTTSSTIIFGDGAETWTENMTIQGSISVSSNINGILFPAIFAGLIVIANIVSLVSFCVEKRLRTYNNYFIINLSILDLLVGLRLVISVAHTHLRYFPFSRTACRVISGFSHAFSSASNMTVVAICIDRHQATYDPINHYMSRSKKKALLKNAVPWLFGIAFWIPYVTVWEFVDGFDNGVHCIRRYQIDTSTMVLQNMILFFLPFLVIAVLYFRIFVKIQSMGTRNIERQFATKETRSKMPEDSVEDAVSTATIDIQLQSTDDGTLELSSSKKTPGESDIKIKVPKHPTKRESIFEMRKATRTLLLIVVAFVIAWLPSSIIHLIYTVEPVLIVPSLPRPIYLFFSYLVYANNLLNPISYAVSQPLFRNTVINMVLCRRR